MHAIQSARHRIRQRIMKPGSDNTPSEANQKRAQQSAFLVGGGIQAGPQLSQHSTHW